MAAQPDEWWAAFTGEAAAAFIAERPVPLRDMSALVVFIIIMGQRIIHMLWVL